jgi:hypothetical protein
MNRFSRKLVVAITLGLAAFATWAVTDFQVPTIESAAAHTSQG